VATDIFEAAARGGELLDPSPPAPDDEAAWQLSKAWVPDLTAGPSPITPVGGAKARLLAGSRVGCCRKAWPNPEALSKSAQLWSPHYRGPSRITKTRKELEPASVLLGWAAGLSAVNETVFAKGHRVVVRDLSRHDPARAAEFMKHSQPLKPYADQRRPTVIIQTSRLKQASRDTDRKRRED